MQYLGSQRGLTVMLALKFDYEFAHEEIEYDCAHRIRILAGQFDCKGEEDRFLGIPKSPDASLTV